MKLTSVSEALKTDAMTGDFIKFISEAAPATFEPSLEKITKCIESRKFASIYYEEEDDPLLVLSGYRLIAPVCFGRGYVYNEQVTHHDEYYLRAFVIKESRKAKNKHLRKIHRTSVSKTERVPYWRLFKFERISTWDTMRFTITEAPAAGYNPNDQMINEILQSIEF